MDEIGSNIGTETDGVVLGRTAKSTTLTKGGGNREWVTVIECISAAGAYTKPTIIFKGKPLQHQWFQEETPDWVYTRSEKGWTHNGVGLGWLRQVFIPGTRSETSESKGRILVLDGHASHVDVEFTDECHRNKVLYIYLPLHTSHAIESWV